jgi:large subunit ribosomal protein LP0
MSEKRERKREIINKIYEKVGKYRSIIIVSLTNVSSNQVQQARFQLRKKKSEIIIGKNTVLRKAINIRLADPDENDPDYDRRRAVFTKLPQIEALLGLCKGKIGLIFTDEAIFDLKTIIEGNRVPAPARVGTFAPADFILPPGPTGLDPSQISFFHVLQIPTKIQKQQIEITKEVQVCAKGRKIGNSEAALLQKLNIKPFSYGMEIKHVFDVSEGVILAPEVFSAPPSEIITRFQNHLRNITALSLQLGLPNQASLPHSIIGAFKNLAAIGLVTGYKFKQLDNLSSGGSAAAAPTTTAAAPKEAPKAVVEEKVEEADVDMGDLFGGA